jgi:hypothetical protein
MPYVKPAPLTPEQILSRELADLVEYKGVNQIKVFVASTGKLFATSDCISFGDDFVFLGGRAYPLAELVKYHIKEKTLQLLFDIPLPKAPMSMAA